MYLATIGEQSRVFLYFCGIGFLLGFLFDVFGLISLFLPRKRSFTIALDFIYMVLCTFLMFIFGLAVHNGSFKFYVYAAAVIGWFIWYFSVGAFVRRVSLSFEEKIRTLFSKFKRGILTCLRKFQSKRVKKSKKSEISSNLLLQDDEGLLYNNGE